MNKQLVIISLFLVASVVLAACGTPARGVAVAAPERPTASEPIPAPKILHLALGPDDVPTLDPALAEDGASLQIIDEAFIGLTYLDVPDAVYKPGMATGWDLAANGDGTQTVTFHLRGGVPWVRWDGKEVKTVKTCDGSADRMVTASDFAYGIERNLNPTNASPYAYLWGFVLKGAADYNNGVTTDFSSVGVQVLDDQTLKLTFLKPVAYNVEIAGMWVGRPQPRWAIEGDCDGAVKGAGERWTEPGFFQSYGPYTVSEWIHDSQITLVKNPFWPGTDAVPVAKIDEIRMRMLDEGAAFAEYEAGNIDSTYVPAPDLDRVRADPVLGPQVVVAPALCASYLGFNTTAPYVKDARVRRALSLAVDRQSLIDNVLRAGQQPAQWFGPPGITGAPTLDSHPDLGIKYDPAAAKSALQSYLDETGQSADQIDITLMFNSSALGERLAVALQQMWASTLGIHIQLANQEWKVYLETTRGPATPQIFRMSWCYDYPDENNFVRDVFAAGGSSNPTDAVGKPSGGVMWKNDRFEELVAQAAIERDPAVRQDLYAQAEEILVNTDAVMIPIYWSSHVFITKPYLHRTTFSGGGAEALHDWDLMPH